MMITTTMSSGKIWMVRARLKQPSRSVMGRLNLMLRPTTTKRMMLTRKHWDSS
ncbi:hypothetical protein M405DRAFT_827677, partial [Rhizopogon salebrosus TDB-379]